MNMSSCEIVQRAIHFDNPSRLPVNFGCFGISDFGWIPRPNLPEEDARWEAERTDIWGCRWERTEMANMGQVKGHPMAGPDDLAHLRVPDYTDDRRYAGAEEALRQAEAEGRYIVSGIFMVLVERMESLLGFENLFAGVLDDEQRPGARATGRLHYRCACDACPGNDAAFPRAHPWLEHVR